MTMNDQYWKRKSLDEMSSAEWEGLCDGCALCCMHKLEDEDTGEIFYTDVACKLLNLETCRCGDYANRVRIVSSCLVLSVDRPEAFNWLPSSCAYRRLANGQPLPAWHPLITGRPESVHEAGVSMLGKAVSERDTDDYTVLRSLADPS
jgi:uncharacterized cysteine cluster protein YcgN (CxxCxxCC family)